MYSMYLTILFMDFLKDFLINSLTRNSISNPLLFFQKNRKTEGLEFPCLEERCGVVVFWSFYSASFLIWEESVCP